MSLTRCLERAASVPAAGGRSERRTRHEVDALERDTQVHLQAVRQRQREREARVVCAHTLEDARSLLGHYYQHVISERVATRLVARWWVELGALIVLAAAVLCAARLLASLDR